MHAVLFQRSHLRSFKPVFLGSVLQTRSSANAAREARRQGAVTGVLGCGIEVEEDEAVASELQNRSVFDRCGCDGRFLAI